MSDLEEESAKRMGATEEIFLARTLDSPVDTRHEPRLATLQTLTAKLARITSSSEVASFVLHQGVAQLGGTSGSLCLVVDNELEITASFGYANDVIETYQRFPIDKMTPAGECALTRESVYCETIDQLYERYPIFRSGPIVGDPSVAVMPLEASNSTLLGTMVIGFATPQHFGVSERALLEAIAREAAVALERARANEELVEARALAEEARDQLAFLAEASIRLSASLDLDETMHQVAAFAVPKIADRCALFLLNGRELQKFSLAPEPNDDERMLFEFRNPTLSDQSGLGAVVRTGQAMFMSKVGESYLEAVATSEEHLDLLHRVEIGGVFLVPLTAHGERIGALAFFNRKDRTFLENERIVAQELTARAAIAIDNARLFSRELQIAETLQRALLPAKLPEIPGVSFASRYVPGSDHLTVGGDWYSAIAIDDRHFAFVVGDVSGKGLQAATTMASVRYTIRALAFEGNSPAAVLEKSSMQLDLGDQGRFATVLIGVVDMERRELTIANAGHLNPLFVTEDLAEFLTSDPGLPIGVEKGSTYRSVTFSIPPRAMLLAFTDGLVERRGESIDVGLERLRDSVVINRGDIEQMVSKVLVDLTKGAPSDDVAMLAVQWTT